MKRTFLFVLAVLLLSQMALAGNLKFGIGVAGGLNYPIGQEDQTQGSIFGFHGRVQAVPAIALEPNIYFTKFGDPVSDEFTYDIQGSKITAYGIDVTLGGAMGGPGVKPYALFGAGFYKASTKTQEGFSSPYNKGTDFGWSAGFGIEVGVTHMVGLDLRGKLVIIPTDGGGSRKSGSVTGGVNYYFGM
jgi:hypothetical protein